MECEGHVHDESLQGAVNPKEVLAVFHLALQAWQNEPFAEGHRGVHLGPQKVPDKVVFRTSVLFKPGEEGKLGQHNKVHAHVAFEFLEEQSVAHTLLGM